MTQSVTLPAWLLAILWVLPLVPTVTALAMLTTRRRRILSGLVIVFLMIDGAIKLVPWPIVP